MTNKIKNKHKPPPLVVQKQPQLLPNNSDIDLINLHVDGPDEGGEPGPSSNELTVEAAALLSRLSPASSPNTQKTALQTFIGKITAPFANRQALRAALEAESALLKQQILEKVEQLWESGEYIKKQDVIFEGIVADGNKGHGSISKDQSFQAQNYTTAKRNPKIDDDAINKIIEETLEKQLGAEVERQKRVASKERVDKAFTTAMSECAKKMEGLPPKNDPEAKSKREQIIAEMKMMQDFVKKLNADKKAEIDAGLTDDTTFLWVPEIPDWVAADENDKDEETLPPAPAPPPPNPQLPSELEQFYADLVDYNNPFAILSEPNPDPDRKKALDFWLDIQRARAVKETENTPVLRKLCKTPLLLLQHCVRKTRQMNAGVDVEYRGDGIMRRIKGGMWVDMGLEEKFGLETMKLLRVKGMDVNKWLETVEEHEEEDQEDGEDNKAQ